MTMLQMAPLAYSRRTASSWSALWAMMVGFFMILLDATIVAVANPAIMEHLDTDYAGVLWVTSSYLLAYAVPLLLAGRLGDRFGPKNLYLCGLVVFTAASLWCGLAGSIEWLITARVVQGVGAALMAPQTLSVITKIFPSDRRGVALGVWGATAGVATLVGPLAGGFLVGLGWQWIFIVNVPIGIVGLGLAIVFVPSLATERPRFDVIGVVLSGTGLFLVVFGLQEGESHAWAWWIWLMVVSGLALVAGFVRWQAVAGEPLIPLTVFRDKDFSMCNVGISVIAFAVTAEVVPLMFYAQAVCGLSPTWAAVLIAPTAVASGLLAPVVGRLVDRVHPCPIVGFGFSAVAISLTWLSIELAPETPVWRLVVPLTILGVGMAFIWAPLATVATRNLPPQLAGAGSGVYNTTRQVGGVLGSAGIAALMTSRLGAELPGVTLGAETTEGTLAELPEFLKEPFSAALSQSLLLPAFVALLGVVAAIFLGGLGDDAFARRAPRARAGVDESDELEAFATALRTRDDVPDDHYFRDDDEYAEYTIDWPEERKPTPRPIPEPSVVDVPADESDTEPLLVHVEHPLHAPADTWHSGPVESWHSLLEEEPEPRVELKPPSAAVNGHDARYGSFDRLMADLGPTPTPREDDPIGFVHNGFHRDGGHRIEPLPNPRPSGGRHARPDDDDEVTYGRHSKRVHD